MHEVWKVREQAQTNTRNIIKIYIFMHFVVLFFAIFHIKAYYKCLLPHIEQNILNLQMGFLK